MRRLIYVMTAALLLGPAVATAQESALYVNRGHGFVYEGRYPSLAACEEVARMQGAAGAQAGCAVITREQLQEEQRQKERATDQAKQDEVIRQLQELREEQAAPKTTECRKYWTRSGWRESCTTRRAY